MDRGERRYRAAKKAKKRAEKWRRTGWNAEEGLFKKEHKGCGCHMCKPWKHGIEPKLKPSERRKIDAPEQD